MSSLENEIQRQKVTALYIINFHENTKKKGQEKLSAEVLQRRLELLESYWNNFFNRQLTICAHKDYSASESSHMVSFEEVEDAYINAGAYLQKMLQQSAPSISAQQSTGSPTTGRLPKINLPTFSGDHVQWESFKDLFTSLVHDAPGLSDVVRLQYLKSSLTGEAAKIISNIPVTDANYRGAWQTLVNRYDNKRLLLYRHFQNLMGLKPMTTESAAALRTLLDTTVETRRALENLGRPVQHWDDWFIYLTTQKLESSLKKDWENSLGDGTHIPNFDELTQFLTNRLATMEVVTPGVRSSSPQIRAHQTSTQTSSSAKTFDSTSRNCVCCKKNHFLGYCPDFKQNSVSQRRDLVAQSRLCFNCLRDHPVSECQSAHRCNLCGAKHHTLLHPDNKAHSSPQSVSSSHARGTHSTLLPTAVVKVTGSNGKTSLARALLDQGSEVTFISEDLAQRLRLPRSKIHVPITGMGDTHCGTVKTQVRVQLSSVTGQASPVSAGAYVLPRFTKAFRPPRLDTKSWPHLLGLSLADDGTFSSSRVDLVIGANLYGTILLDGLVKGGPNSPIAQNTIFGWVLSGRLGKSHRSSTVGLNSLHCSVDSLSDELRRFWEIEEEASTPPLTPEEELCETHFQTTHERAPDGRFIVRLPKGPNVQLGMSYSTALQVLQRNEKRQRRDIVYANAYRTFMQEYVHLGHMEPAPATLDLSRDCYYLPHHAVWKSEGQSLKIRIVFNASFRTSTGSSLNDCLLSGPKLQRDISQVLLIQGRHAIVFTADTVKIFRQIWVHPEDRHLQRILWRDSPEAVKLKDDLKSLLMAGGFELAFLGSEGLLRVGGHLEHGDLGYDEKHPYIIPAQCNFSRLLIINHVLHGGLQLTLSHLYSRFRIIKGRRLVRDVIHSCVRCARHDARIDVPLMGQLPSPRISPSRPFLHTGLDHAGPLQLRTTSGRGHKSYKGCIALFVCILRRFSEQFYHRWTREYLQYLQQRSKWRNITDNIRVNDLVLVAEDNLPPTQWCLDRITQVHPGPDGIVRVVNLRTTTTELQRPTARLCRLPIESSSQLQNFRLASSFQPADGHLHTRRSNYHDSIHPLHSFIRIIVSSKTRRAVCSGKNRSP